MKTKMKTLVATLVVAAIATTIGAQSASATTYGWAAQSIDLTKKSIWSDVAYASNGSLSISADQWNYDDGTGDNVALKYEIYTTGGVLKGTATIQTPSGLSTIITGGKGGAFGSPFAYKFLVGPGDYKIKITNVGNATVYSAGNIYQ